MADAPPAVDKQSDKVMVVVNLNSPDSIAIGDYYVKRRGIPRSNMVFLKCSTDEEVPVEEYNRQIEDLVHDKLRDSNTDFQYIVTTKGVPLRVQRSGYSINALLACVEMDLPPMHGMTEDEFKRLLNPYFHADEEFDHKKFHIYLTTRLDGYTADGVTKMIESGLKAKPEKGLFFFAESSDRFSAAFAPMQATLPQAYSLVTRDGFQARLQRTGKFMAPDEAMMGYASWGSNDGTFKADVYHALKFKPGSITQTFVSTSGRSFFTVEKGQSLMADLLRQGACGAAAYVSEPYTFALNRPEITFDRYVSGYNLAESYWMGSTILKWKEVIIGDPLLRPYPKRS